MSGRKSQPPEVRADLWWTSDGAGVGPAIQISGLKDNDAGEFMLSLSQAKALVCHLVRVIDKAKEGYGTGGHL